VYNIAKHVTYFTCIEVRNYFSSIAKYAKESNNKTITKHTKENMCPIAERTPQ